MAKIGQKWPILGVPRGGVPRRGGQKPLSTASTHTFFPFWGVIFRRFWGVRTPRNRQKSSILADFGGVPGDPLGDPQNRSFLTIFMKITENRRFWGVPRGDPQNDRFWTPLGGTPPKRTPSGGTPSRGTPLRGGPPLQGGGPLSVDGGGGGGVAFTNLYFFRRVSNKCVSRR